jgi:hypothetical protein
MFDSNLIQNDFFYQTGGSTSVLIAPEVTILNSLRYWCNFNLAVRNNLSTIIRTHALLSQFRIWRDGHHGLDLLPFPCGDLFAILRIRTSWFSVRSIINSHDNNKHDFMHQNTAIERTELLKRDVTDWLSTQVYHPLQLLVCTDRQTSTATVHITTSPKFRSC